MAYIEGFILAVPETNKEKYRQFAAEALPFFKQCGVTRMVETWADDVPDGKVTDFKGAVQKQDDERVVYSWIEWPSKEVRDAAWAKLMADPRSRNQPMPFDGKRLIHGGFRPILDA